MFVMADVGVEAPGAAAVELGLIVLVFERAAAVVSGVVAVDGIAVLVFAVIVFAFKDDAFDVVVG